MRWFQWIGILVVVFLVMAVTSLFTDVMLRGLFAGRFYKSPVKENCQQVQAGMTVSEVEAVMHRRGFPHQEEYNGGKLIFYGETGIDDVGCVIDLDGIQGRAVRATLDPKALSMSSRSWWLGE